MNERADGKLTLADLIADPKNPFILDDPWLDPEADPPPCWWYRILTPDELKAVTWR
jgi:hypothetical protein